MRTLAAFVFGFLLTIWLILGMDVAKASEASEAVPVGCNPHEGIFERLIRHEGRRNCVYVDTEGVKTIGIGHALPPDAPDTLCWTAREIYDQLHQDIETAEAAAYLDLANPIWWAHMPRVTRETLIELAFQLGGRGLHGFEHMLDAVRRSQWERAADELLDSKLARETPHRTRELACLLRMGPWEDFIDTYLEKMEKDSG